ncbi:DUF924 family protein [Niveispirillum sp. KHB5.9]|uniref:DUF924 family protein n=1 Tax=Niveispirillum sp. KHB5.9 TaxID=3400269 RepID=UPI003A8A9F8D
MRASDIDGVLAFWFQEAGPAKWFGGGPDFDVQVTKNLLAAHLAASNGDLADWAEVPEGVLALCILLDQAPRNMFRNTPRAFATDHLALAIATDAIAREQDLMLPEDQRLFIYLPFEHSEQIEDQRLAVRLFANRTRDPALLDYACRHLAVIAQYGRFPHRNKVLGRESTEAEQAYLAMPGSGF